jgi:hypothetical protein
MDLLQSFVDLRGVGHRFFSADKTCVHLWPASSCIGQFRFAEPDEKQSSLFFIPASLAFARSGLRLPPRETLQNTSYFVDLRGVGHRFLSADKTRDPASLAFARSGLRLPPRETLQNTSYFVDLRGVEPRPRPCHGRVLPLYYRPK